MRKNRTPLDAYEYDVMPRAQKVYLMRYGWHFSRAASRYAAEQMRKINRTTGKMERVQPYTKEEVDELLQRYNVQVENKGGYDYVFAAQMCRADYLGSSIPDEAHLALYVKDVCDDVDASDGVTMRRWYATMVGNGESIEWDDILDAGND